jgi:hypothetical protein
MQGRSRRRVASEVDENELLAVEKIKPARGPDPEPSGAVFEKRPNRVVDQTGRVLGVILEDHETIAVEKVQSVHGPEPQEPLPVLEHAENGGLRQPGLNGDLLEAADAGILAAQTAGQGKERQGAQRFRIGEPLVSLI